MKLLEKKNAVITGGSDGIGLGIAHEFAKNGANLILVGREIEKLQKSLEELADYQVNIHLISADLSDVEQIKSLSEQILQHFSKVNILVNNAGIGKFVPFQQTDENLLDLHLNLNVKAPYLLTQQLLPTLVESKGNVINISSYFAHRMLVGRTTTAYSLTKGAINSFTKSLAFEVGHLGVRVNAIAPGSIATPQFERNLMSLSAENQGDFHKMVKNIYPLGKIGDVKDIGKMAVFLASENASWITGGIFAVDGGLTTN